MTPNVTKNTTRRVAKMATSTTEAELQAQVIELARLTGWRTMHVRRSLAKGQRWTTTTSVVGWPDLVMWHEVRQLLLFVELKSDVGIVSIEQAEVIRSLTAAGQCAQVWTPSDWDHIESVLVGPR